MDGVSIIETAILQELINKIEKFSERVEAIHQELNDAKKPYLTAHEVSAIIGYTLRWLNDNKQHIGFSMVGGQLRFKRKDVDSYMSQQYFKTKQPKRSK
jgi:sugar-specific transcriptional regulator TrmB